VDLEGLVRETGSAEWGRVGCSGWSGASDCGCYVVWMLAVERREGGRGRTLCEVELHASRVR
jgi:hypothetical protein